MPKLRWTVELEVDETWVSDGFNLSDQRAKEMLANSLPYAYGHELEARVVASPDPKRILNLFGYRVKKNQNPFAILNKLVEEGRA